MRRAPMGTWEALDATQAPCLIRDGDLVPRQDRFSIGHELAGPARVGSVVVNETNGERSIISNVLGSSQNVSGVRMLLGGHWDGRCPFLQDPR